MLFYREICECLSSIPKEIFFIFIRHVVFDIRYVTCVCYVWLRSKSMQCFWMVETNMNARSLSLFHQFYRTWNQTLNSLLYVFILFYNHSSYIILISYHEAEWDWTRVAVWMTSYVVKNIWLYFLDSFFCWEFFYFSFVAFFYFLYVKCLCYS